jgi:hypothetical protein
MDRYTLRHQLLPWVQDHFIQRYSDQSVVSHHEAVEELCDLVLGGDGVDGVHPCCGCSCHVCAHGHDMSDGPKGHTTECKERFWAAQIRGL